MRNFEIKPAYEYEEEIRALFEEYTQMLLTHHPDFAKYLAVQNYDEELKHLEDKYGLPTGRLYLVCVDGKAAGCIGLRWIDDTSCEMKRLYVKPEYRGQGIAKKLVEVIIEDAKEIGYKEMLLDTFPVLEAAIDLYRKYGFCEIESYNNNPMDELIYLRLEL